MSLKEQVKIKIDHLTEEQVRALNAVIETWEPEIEDEELTDEEKEAIAEWRSMTDEEKMAQGTPRDEALKELGLL